VLFEGDQDQDILDGLDEAIGFRAMMDAGGKDAETTAAVRQRLDADGLGGRLLDKYRNADDGWRGKYEMIIVAALMMCAGAKIGEEDMRYLRGVVPQINCNEGFTPAIWDEGFRGPGRRQFLAALDKYVPGTPRSFSAPCCYWCGKIRDDIGKGLRWCGRCKRAWYCDEVCDVADMLPPMTRWY
jgi:hypothetical protein